jgi:hypothetical protein
MSRADHFLRSCATITALACFAFASVAQRVGVNVTGATPHASALLDVDAAGLPANGKLAMLIPRMTSTERAAIPAPATSLLVYDTTTMQFWYFNGTAWVAWLNTNDVWKITGNTGLTAGTHFIGTTNAVDIQLRVNGVEAGILSEPVTAFGYRAHESTQTTATDGTAFGYEALGNTVSGQPQTKNTAAGHQAMICLTIGGSNTTVGSETLLTTTLPFTSGTTAVGHRAARDDNSGFCTAVGHRAVEVTGTFSWVVGVGAQSMMANVDLYSEVGIGYQAGINGANGVGRGSAMGDSGHGFGVGACAASDQYTNYGFGYNALNNVTTGDHNCAVGAGALQTGTNVDECTAVGAQSLSIATGDGNTAMGFAALDGVSSGTYNTALGAFAGPAVGTLSYTSAIGANATPTATGRIVFGTTASNNLTGGYGAWQNPSDARFKRDVQADVPGLELITALRPVSYRLDAPAIERFTGAEARLERNVSADELAAHRASWERVAQVRHTGLLAQEAAGVLHSLGRCADIVHVPTEPQDHYTVGYATLVAPLVQAMQQQQERIAVLRASNKELMGRLDKALIHSAPSAGTVQPSMP